jgi:hypothetical protein
MLEKVILLEALVQHRQIIIKLLAKLTRCSGAGKAFNVAAVCLKLTDCDVEAVIKRPLDLESPL